jgi:hypothetical protein
VNRQRLRELAAAEYVRSDAYSFDGGLPSERYVIAIVEGGWAVYYSERGERTGLRIFETEDDACSHLFDLLLRDPTTREGYGKP